MNKLPSLDKIGLPPLDAQKPQSEEPKVAEQKFALPPLAESSLPEDIEGEGIEELSAEDYLHEEIYHPEEFDEMPIIISNDEIVESIEDVEDVESDEFDEENLNVFFDNLKKKLKGLFKKSKKQKKGKQNKLKPTKSNKVSIIVGLVFLLIVIAAGVWFFLFRAPSGYTRLTEVNLVALEDNEAKIIVHELQRTESSIVAIIENANDMTIDFFISADVKGKDEISCVSDITVMENNTDTKELILYCNNGIDEDPYVSLSITENR